MISAILSRIVILVLGTLYPAYASYKAVKTKNVREYVKWMVYWIVFAIFTCVETFADIFISWMPFYYELKIVLVLWLMSPATEGAKILYRKFIHPQLSKREKEIDSAIAKATEQGYSAILSLGQKGISYATNVIISTAVKGQAKIADQIKKSYSMSDITADAIDNRIRDGGDDDDGAFDDDDDEVDNRLIAERYNREQQELASRETTLRRTTSARVPKAKETDLHSVEEMTEEGEMEKSRSTRSSKRSPYQHKEAYHYGTLPRQKTRQRHAINKAP